MAINYRQDLTLSLTDLTGFEAQADYVFVVTLNKFHSLSKLFSYNRNVNTQCLNVICFIFSLFFILENYF